MNTDLNKLENRTRKNTLNLAYWTGGWMLTMAIASFGPALVWNHNAGASIFFILLNVIVGIGMILANRRYVNGLDELHRKLNIDAMALALGIGVVGGLGYSMFDVANVIAFDAEISHLVILISLTYLIGIIAGNLKYK